MDNAKLVSLHCIWCTFTSTNSKAIVHHEQSEHEDEMKEYHWIEYGHALGSEECIKVNELARD